jgi:fimbrial chaperone protein
VVKKAIVTAAFRAAFYLWLAGSPVLAWAGSFQVTPIRLEFSAQQRTAALTVRNDSAEPLVIQIELTDWSQRDSQDVYAETSDLLATPPIVTVAAGRDQVFRVGLRRAPDPSRELSYRVFLREIVPPPPPDFTGLQVSLRVGVPAFVKPIAAGARPVLAWSARMAPDGRLSVTAKNSGNMHVQVVEFKLTIPGTETVAATSDQMSYLLAEQTREWLLDLKAALPAGVTRLHLMAQTDAGPIEAELALDSR